MDAHSGLGWCLDALALIAPLNRTTLDNQPRYRVTVSGEQPWATEPVDLVDADPSWTVWGEHEHGHLETLFASWLIGRIEHVGSTAVPHLGVGDAAAARG